MEDLSLKYTEPELFNDIKNNLEKTKDNQNLYIRNFARKISEKFYKEPKFFEDLVVVVSNFTIELEILSKSISDLLES